MTFIHTHESSGKKYTFYDKKLSSNTNNIFTILVGKNGSGKSRLLNSLIMRRLKDEKYVLAFSNSMYHKFPQLRTYGSKYYCYANYQGLQKNFSYCDALNKLIDYKLIEILDQKNLFDVSPILQYKDWSIRTLIPLLMLKLKQDPIREHLLDKILLFLDFDKNLHITFNKNKKNSDFFMGTYNNNLLYFENKTENHEILKQIYLNLCDSKLTDYYFPLASNLKSFSFLSYGIALGLWNIKKIDFTKKNHKVSYRDLSSGETSFLTLGLFLLIFLENDSLVCIDEPEINLHPEWQNQVLNFLNSVFSNFENCHFFIATHAPQIVSGTDYLHTYIHNLEKNETYSIDHFKNRSSDFQLSEIFNFPGNNNEYLIRKLIIILNKFNIEIDFHLDDESKALLEHLEKLIKHEKIDKEDKVFILFNLIASYRG